ncbi:hypothetical protein ElyMa_003124200 [Elysia marginata]|uniref:Uncharacterized protein n=1 Tax=Elysia marginata TaxID=1093978 RepID=A0AAV4IUJ8_9GAST|nr:hypothetical protein ElyMa_003124200 [Elysia marginata]
MALRRKAKQDSSRYKSIDKEIKKMCNEAKEEWINGQCKEIEDCKKADNAYMHQKINDIASKKRTAQGGCIKSKDGKILMETSDILERWSEYNPRALL